MSSNKKIVVRLFSGVSFMLAFIAIYLVSYQPTLAEKILYTGKENHTVDVEMAKKWTGNFQVAAQAGDIMAGYMGRDIFEKILSQSGCVGIRIYNARLDSGSPTFVIVGVDGQGNDIVGGIVGEDVYPCPPWCATGANLLEKEAVALAK